MTNRDVITLCNGGFLAATGHSLPVEHFYRFCRFRHAVERANRAIGEAQLALLKDCGIEPGKFADAPAEALERFNVANDALLAEESGVDVKARIPIALYKGIYDENKTAERDIFADIAMEVIVLDNLFSKEE